MRALIFAGILFLCASSESFCGEIISSGVEKKEKVYYIKIKLRVDAEKEKVLEIFSDPEKLKKSRTILRKAGLLKDMKAV